MELKNRKSVVDSLQKYCICSNNKDDTIEITEWSNGEGVDVTIIYDKNEKSLSLSFDEIDAIHYLIQVLRYERQ